MWILSAIANAQQKSAGRSAASSACSKRQPCGCPMGAADRRIIHQASRIIPRADTSRMWVARAEV
jgi:hypothetical protein